MIITDLSSASSEAAGTLALVDEIEVWLTYQNKLRKPLGLT
ncbi:hypothetical protein G3760_005162, partial [Salmonella enterica]|nr:hypothetical protein [Salmonella enterica]